MVGDKMFAAHYDLKVPKTWRVVNQYDWIPLLPTELLNYHHVDTELELTYGFNVWPLPTVRHDLNTYLKGVQQLP